MARKADGDLNINTKINTDGVDKGLADLKTKLSKISGTNIIKGITGLGAAFAGVTSAVKLTTKVIKETSEAYRIQATAEKQLETAAKNNPYLDAQSVKALKDYAGALQNIGTVGDETIIPLMSQLANAGRNQIEIQEILKTALDMDAAGVMSLDQAVTTLNATYSGNIGLLGRQYSDLKNLTAEELASGKAVQVLGEKFKGMAEETAKATGTSQQLKNAIGDYKEEVGASFEKNMAPMRKFFTELINGWTNAKKARREYEEAKEKNEAGNSTSVTLETQLKTEQEKFESIATNATRAAELLEMTDKQLKKTAEYSEFTTWSDSSNPLEDFKTTQQDVINNYNTQKELVEKLNKELKDAVETEKAQVEAAKQAAAAAASAAEQDERNKAALKFMKENEKALNTQIEQIKKEAELRGEEVDQQEILNAYIKSYVDLVTTSDLVTENNPYSKKRLAELQAYAAGIEVIDEKYEELLKNIKEFLGDSDSSKLSDSIQTTIDALTEENKALEENSDAWKTNAEKIAELEALKTQVIEKETELQKAEVLEQAQTIVSTISEYLNQFSSIVNNIVELAAQASNNQTQQELSNLSEQYNNGLVSYEEYCEKKKAISKKAAQEEYRQQLWQYHANILTATANAALAVLKAYADFGYVGGTIAGAAAALSLATVIANKPQMPAYANGGIVGGNSFTGDKIISRLNSGEMVLNQQQQAQLFKMANGYGNGGGISLNVDIVNNMGDSAKVSQQVTARGLRLTVDRIVNSSMSEGKYNNGLTSANNLLNGVSYL